VWWLPTCLNRPSRQTVYSVVKGALYSSTIGLAAMWMYRVPGTNGSACCVAEKRGEGCGIVPMGKLLAEGGDRPQKWVTEWVSRHVVVTCY
jgi:hypothetical protein